MKRIHQSCPFLVSAKQGLAGSAFDLRVGLSQACRAYLKHRVPPPRTPGCPGIRA